MSFLRFAFRNHPYLSIVLVMAVCALGYFGFGFLSEAIYFADPAHQEQPLALWMTPKYVGLSWDLPPGIIREVMELEPRDGGRPPRLAEVIDNLGITLEELETRVRDAKDAHELEKAEQRP